MVSKTVIDPVPWGLLSSLYFLVLRSLESQFLLRKVRKLMNSLQCFQEILILCKIKYLTQSRCPIKFNSPPTPTDTGRESAFHYLGYFLMTIEIPWVPLRFMIYIISYKRPQGRKSAQQLTSERGNGSPTKLITPQAFHPSQIYLLEFPDSLTLQSGQISGLPLKVKI